jgi:hypothetical protein
MSVAGSTDALLQAAVPVARRETRYHLLSAAAGTEIVAPNTSFISAQVIYTCTSITNAFQNALNTLRLVRH